MEVLGRSWYKNVVSHSKTLGRKSELTPKCFVCNTDPTRLKAGRPATWTHSLTATLCPAPTGGRRLPWWRRNTSIWIVGNEVNCHEQCQRSVMTMKSGLSADRIHTSHRIRKVRKWKNRTTNIKFLFLFLYVYEELKVLGSPLVGWRP